MKPLSPAAIAIVVLVTAVGTIVTQSGALAHVQSTDRRTGMPIRWEGTRCVVVQAAASGCADIADGSEFRALVDAARSWELAVADCSYLRFVVREPWAASEGSEGLDGVVGVTWIKDGWSSLPVHSPDHIALTAIWSHEGQIQDAEVEINDEHYLFSLTGEADTLDLQSTLTHELGHVLGLDELCYLGASAPDPLPVDHLGRPIPPCAQAAQELREATMYPTSGPGETLRRTPAADDVAGVCTLYPLVNRPERCVAEQRSGGGCSVAGAAGDVWPLLGVVALLLRRRRLPARGPPGRAFGGPVIGRANAPPGQKMVCRLKENV